MCGIVAAASYQNVVPILLEGLQRLEYRGYDSCGVAVLKGSEILRARSVARVKDQVESESIQGNTGIAHTRWATHGRPEVANAHPIVSRDEIAIVHNGIIENYESIRDELTKEGYVFTSQTDTEALAHLIHKHYHGDLLKAVQSALLKVHGSFAIAVVSGREPNRVVAARQGSPMVLGVGNHENFVASDAMAIASVTDRIVFLQEGDGVDMTPDSWTVYSRAADGEYLAVERELRIVNAYSAVAELGPYRHYMQKEIFEQPRAIGDTLEGVVEISSSLFGRYFPVWTECSF